MALAGQPSVSYWFHQNGQCSAGKPSYEKPGCLFSLSKIAATTVSSNLCNHARSACGRRPYRRVPSKVLIVVESGNVDDGGIGMAAVNFKHIICSNFADPGQLFCLEGGCGAADTRNMPYQ